MFEDTKELRSRSAGKSKLGSWIRNSFVSSSEFLGKQEKENYQNEELIKRVIGREIFSAGIENELMKSNTTPTSRDIHSILKNYQSTPWRQVLSPLIGGI
eukprot:Gregarina_sp_Poly_1__493@NODE_111_length_13906_cov_58_362887_g98_i0_p17_GENE_NODE_111_length_13906_cov_58_362887_g98_i0NODE_111_length_13906_cov_58_362887_g98_i0_p17_ORF_typecomplete_len100_score10_75_NODE_111_length_13906_cov_58_362887_g98_i092929591